MRLLPWNSDQRCARNWNAGGGLASYDHAERMLAQRDTDVYGAPGMFDLKRLERPWTA